MDLTHVILGPIVTEKAERLKAQGVKHTYTLRVAPQATKIDIEHALRRFYEVEIDQIRVFWVRPKRRVLGGSRVMEKRHAFKKALVTLSTGSRALDLAAFHTT
jgi:ribosomal protein L23